MGEIDKTKYMKTIYKRIKRKITRGINYAYYGATFFSKIKLFLLPWIFTRKWLSDILKLLNQKKGLSLLITRFGNTATCYIYDYADYCVFREIFVQDVYNQEVVTDPRIIFDLGSNTGFSIIFFKLKYPKAVVYGFEPNPLIFNRLQNNVCQFNDSVHIFNWLVSDSNEMVDFYVKEDSSLSSSTVNRGKEFTSVSVQSYTMYELTKKIGIANIDVVKMDIEGSEYDVLLSISDYSFIHSIIGEFHTELVDQDLETFTQLLGKEFALVRTTKKSDKRYMFVAV